MKHTGEILKENRLSKKLTLDDISQELKISVEVLSDIENNILKNEINSVFILGHFRSYCEFLELNYQELVIQFKNDNFPKKVEKIEIEKPKVEYKLFISNKFMSFSLIILIFSTFYFLFIQNDKTSREYAIIPDLPENYISVIERSSLENLKTNQTKIIIQEENSIDDKILPNSSSAIASVSSFDDKISQQITLKFLDDTWVQLRDANDVIILSRLMNKNDEYSYNLDNNYSITSGNAGHILVLIDEKVRGKIGKKGQVVDSFIINKNFNN
tara:strand:- start:7258 stop:8070 length:813 start_codon:yes stop_codon:yes gene_type:complete